MKEYDKEITEKYQEILEMDTTDEAYDIGSGIKIQSLLNRTRVENFPTFHTPENVAKIVYRAAYTKYSHQLSHYFRSLYHVLSYLHKCEDRELLRDAWEVEIGDKVELKIEINGKLIVNDHIHKKYKQYAQFIQAQMTTSELFLVYYNGLFFPKMKKLLHHYSFLENLNSDDLLDGERDKMFYKACRIGNQEFKAITLKSKAEMLKI